MRRTAFSLGASSRWVITCASDCELSRGLYVIKCIAILPGFKVYTFLNNISNRNKNFLQFTIEISSKSITLFFSIVLHFIHIFNVNRIES